MNRATTEAFARKTLTLALLTILTLAVTSMLMAVRPGGRGGVTDTVWPGS